jgi:RecJ-like exonuclease
MNATKLQDLILATEGMDTWDLKDSKNRSRVARLTPKLIKALKEVALEVKCEECHGRGFITGATSSPVYTRGKCDVCKGTGNKYFFLEVL